MEENKNIMLNEVINISGSKVVVENGVVKKILNENNQSTNYLDFESAFEIINNEIDMIYSNDV